MSLEGFEIAPEEFGSTSAQVAAGLVQFNAAFVGNSAPVRLSFAARNAQSEFVGGIAGRVYADCLLIDLLWLEPSARRHGVGSRLMHVIENTARESGAIAALVDTFDFQAATFYEKLGYVEEARLTAMVSGRDRIYLTKRKL